MSLEIEGILTHPFKEQLGHDVNAAKRLANSAECIGVQKVEIAGLL